MDIEKLHLAWHHWNALFFDNELPGPPRIVFEALPDGVLARYRFSTKEIVLYDGFLRNFLSGPLVSELASHIVIHEMCHAWVDHFGGGDHEHHGRKFGLIANRVGPKLGVTECRYEDLWCWPDHADEGMHAYYDARTSHGEIMQSEILSKQWE